MQIDWITVAAQIVNFLILVWLLRHFLYRPIIDAMKRREQRIADRLEEARQRESEAEQEAERHRNAQRDLEEKREAKLAEAEREAEEKRKQLTREAREEVDRMADQWRKEVADERKRFLADLRRQAAGRLTAIARAALAELADQDLEAKIADVFCDRLAHIDEDERAALADGANEAGRVTISSAFDLPSAQKGRITRTVHDRLGDDLDVDYRRAGDLTCGIALAVGGRTVAWSLDAWIDDLENALGEALEPPRSHGDADSEGSTEAEGAEKDNGTRQSDERSNDRGDRPSDRAAEAG